jgi:hypothetical protein
LKPAWISSLRRSSELRAIMSQHTTAVIEASTAFGEDA